MDDIISVPLKDEQGHTIGRAEVHPGGEVHAKIDNWAYAEALMWNLTHGISAGVNMGPFSIHAEPKHRSDDNG